MAMFNEIQEKIDNKKADFKATYTSKIKEDIGAGLYNRLKKALKADIGLKTRYTTILEGLSNSSETETVKASSESN
jgi:hypothetical protein